jgi:hypothetical protein
VKLVRDALAGIAARFHLVGLYALIDLLLRLANSMALHDDEWIGPFYFLSFVANGFIFAVFGLAYHAAVDDERAPKPSPLHLGMLLFLPLFWLQLRLMFCVIAPIALGAWGWFAWRMPGASADEWAKSTQYWFAPFAEALVLLMMLAATPVAIWLREHGRRGAPVRDGMRIFLRRWTAGLTVAGIVAPALVLDAVVHFLKGPGVEDVVPTIPECLTMILEAYLTLVALFAASRVVVWSARTSAPEPRPADPAASAPGPPA